MKKDYMKSLEEINRMTSRLRSINESIDFAADYDGEFDDVEDTPAADASSEGRKESAPSEDAKGLEEFGDEVDQIREIALKGMIRLCRRTEDPAYDTLKKIFQFCDKANDRKDESQIVK